MTSTELSLKQMITVDDQREILMKPVNNCLTEIIKFYPKMPTLDEISKGVNGKYPDWLKNESFIDKLNVFLHNADLTTITELQQQLVSYFNLIENKVFTWDYCSNKIGEDNGKDVLCDNFNDFKYEDGQVTCNNCGLVLRDDFAFNERRAYTTEEVSKVKQNEPRWRDVRPRTLVPRENKDGLGKLLSASHKTLYSRLSKIHSSLVTSEERNRWEAIPKFKRVKDYFDDSIMEWSWTIYKAAAKKKLSMGRTIWQFVAASIYAAVRDSSNPRLLSDIAREVEVISQGLEGKPLERLISSSMKIMMKEGVFNDLGIVINQLNVKDYAPTYCNKVKFPHYLTKEVVDIIDLLANSKHSTTDIKKRFVRYNIQGRDPAGIIAAAMYLTLRKEKKRVDRLIKSKQRTEQLNKLTEIIVEMYMCVQGYDKNMYSKGYSFKSGNITQKLASFYMDVTEVTLRSNAKEIKKAIKHSGGDPNLY